MSEKVAEPSRRSTYVLIATMLVGLILFIILFVLYDTSLHPPTKVSHHRRKNLGYFNPEILSQ